MVAAAGSTGLTEACLAQTDIAEHTALDLAFLNTQWFMVQLLVTAGDCAALGCPPDVCYVTCFSVCLPEMHVDFAHP